MLLWTLYSLSFLRSDFAQFIKILLVGLLGPLYVLTELNDPKRSYGYELLYPSLIIALVLISLIWFGLSRRQSKIWPSLVGIAAFIWVCSGVFVLACIGRTCVG